MLYTLGGTKAFFEEHVPLDRALKLTVDGKKVDIPPDVFGEKDKKNPFSFFLTFSRIDGFKH